MDISSIIDNIKFGIASGHNGSVKVKESSALFDLLDDKKSLRGKGEPFHIHNPFYNFQRSRIPLSRLIWDFSIFLVEGFIFLLYAVCSWITKIFFGRKTEKEPLFSLKSIQNFSTSPRFNFIIFFLTAVSSAVFLFIILVFFLKSVLLFKPNSSINQQGAFVVPQYCGKEQYMYLFNSANLWANTGIKVLEGDKLTVSASGSFYSSISNLNESSKLNKVTTYSRSLISDTTDSIEESSLLIYNKKDARFGSLLLQIKEDEQLDYDCQNDGSIIQINNYNRKKLETIIIEKSGNLYFAVNDIYLSDDILKKFPKNHYLQNKYNLKTYIDNNGKKCHIDTIDNYNLFPKEMWFYDNVGEILLNIVIIRNKLTDGNIYSPLGTAYRSIETKASLNNWSCFHYIGLVLFCLFLLADFLFIGKLVNKIAPSSKYKKYII